MSPHALLRACLASVIAIGLVCPGGAAAQGGRKAVPRAPVPHASAPRPLPAHPPRTSGAVVFIGGYFYDPFFGPYPWWPRTAYPYWYVPRYDLRGHLRVRATPHEAAVYVDGFYAGLVEDFDGLFERLPLTPGGHDIALYLWGYATARWRVYLQPGADITLRATLVPLAAGVPSEPPPLAPRVPAPPEGTYTLPRVPPGIPVPETSAAPTVTGFGTVVVRAAPAGAAVRIDNVDCVSSSPGYYEAYVAPGAHTVEVTFPGHVPYVREVRVQEGKTEVINVTLPPT